MLTRRWITVLLVAVLAAVTIGFSRLEMGFHSVPEVVIGAIVGVSGAIILVRLAGTPPTRRPVRLLAIAGAIAVLLHGVRLPAEAAIWRASSGALDFVPACRGEAGTDQR